MDLSYDSGFVFEIVYYDGAHPMKLLQLSASILWNFCSYLSASIQYTFAVEVPRSTSIGNLSPIAQCSVINDLDAIERVNRQPFFSRIK